MELEKIEMNKETIEDKQNDRQNTVQGEKRFNPSSFFNNFFLK